MLGRNANPMWGYNAKFHVESPREVSTYGKHPNGSSKPAVATILKQLIVLYLMVL